MTTIVTSGGISTGSPSISDLITKPTGGSIGDVAGQVVTGAVQYYDALNQINAAKYQSKLLKAQAQGAVASAKAGGVNAAEVARAGVPSPSLLLVAGLGLAALLILKR